MTTTAACILTAQIRRITDRVIAEGREPTAGERIAVAQLQAKRAKLAR